jgi:flavin-dependent dehydrogenase
MKLAIIGAGPGGLYAALAAAGQGLQVDLWEKGRVGEGIVCGECSIP